MIWPTPTEVALARDPAVFVVALGTLREAIMRDYPARTGLTPRVFEVAASSGAGTIA